QKNGAGWEKEQFVVKESTIQTPYYDIEWSVTGQLIKLFDRQWNRNVFALGESAKVLQVFEDKPIDHEAWDIDIFYQEKMKVIENLRNVRVLETGRVRAVIRFEWSYMDSTVMQDMILYAHSRRIDF